MWGWRRLQFGPWVLPTAGTLPRLQTAVTAYSYIPSNGTMDKQESRCPRPGPLRLFVLTCLLILVVILTYPMLRTFSLWFHSSLTRNHVSGTYSIVFVNCPNEQIAKDVARAILDKKLAASVNILPKTSSLYFWKGEIEESTEILLLIKTKTSKVSRLSTYVRLAHPFEIPEVFSIAMDHGDARYLKWLEEGMKEN